MNISMDDSEPKLIKSSPSVLECDQIKDVNSQNQILGTSSQFLSQIEVDDIVDWMVDDINHLIINEIIDDAKTDKNV